jgi:hypothetical protein
MADDYRLQRINDNQYNHLDADNDVAQALYSVNDILLDLSNGTKSVDDYGLPALELHRRREANVLNFGGGVRDELTREQHQVLATNNELTMNADQLRAYRRINLIIEQELPHLFFLDAPGGTGKTFIFSTLYSHWKARDKRILAVASSCCNSPSQWKNCFFSICYSPDMYSRLYIEDY